MDVRALLDALGRTTEVEVRVHAPEPSPVVHCDRAHLRRILSNLLSHVVQGVRPGRIAFDIQVTSDGGQVRVAFRDGGAPIPPSLLSQVFEPFVTGDRGRGTGLGLTLAHRLAERLGASIGVSTSEDDGSTFTLRLPVGAPLVRLPSPVPAVAPPEPAARPWTARDRLRLRSVASLVVGMAGLLGIQLLTPSMRPSIGVTLMFGALFVGALRLTAAGWATVAAWVVVGVGLPMFAVRLATSGGADGPSAVYLPMAAMTAWTWLGRKVGLGVMTALVGVLVATWAFLPPRAVPVEPDRLLTNLVAVALGAAFVALMTTDLRAMANLAFRRAAEAEASAVEACALDGTRDRFLAMVSHELRTPLDTVLGYAELLREEEDDPDRGRDLARIHAAGRQLLGLVDDLLDMSRIQTDDLSLELEPVDIGPLIEEVVSTTGPLTAAQNDRIVVHIAADLPRLVSDRRRMRQILLNLLSNSAKYATDGEIRIEIEAVGCEMLLAVRDGGIGIAPERMSELFQPFVQLHEGLERRPGVGLGLALSQRLAAELGGRIEAESVLDAGSTFTLRLPL